MAWPRQRARNGVAPLFLRAPSSAVLDLDSAGADGAIILCPARHSPPNWVTPRTGSRGYEAVAMRLASPAVRARTQGVIAWRVPHRSVTRALAVT